MLLKNCSMPTIIESKLSGFLLGCLWLIVIFWLLFAGNGDIFGIQIFYISIFLFLLMLKLEYVKKIKFNKINFVITLIFLALLFFLMYKLDYPDGHYYFWPLQIVISYFILLYLVEVIGSNKSHSFYSGITFSALFLILFLAIGSFVFSDGGRSGFIFGPNIHYRIYAVLYVFILYSLIKNNCKSKVLYLFLFSIYVVANFLTGSRASLINIPIILFATIHAYNGRYVFKYSYLFPLLMLFFLMGIIAFNFEINTRLLNFDFENNNSLRLRVQPWVDFVNYPTDYIFSFGMHYSSFYQKFGALEFPYPHNIFLELTFFFGFIGGLVALFIFKELISCCWKLLSLRYSNLGVPFIYLFVFFFIGASFSGSLLDNYILITILLVCKYIQTSDSL